MSIQTKCSIAAGVLTILSSCTTSSNSTDATVDATKVKMEKPNILWIIAEDMNPWMSCYGDPLLKTPTFDKMAKEGVMFTRAYVSAPVCSPCRSALITGVMQTSLGLHNHRSSRIQSKVPAHAKLGLISLPEGVKTIPEIFQDNGYVTFNKGKTDYNFVYDNSKIYNVKGWEDAKKMGKPFFGQIQLAGGKKGHKSLPKDNKRPISPDQVKVPLYYPDNDIYKEAYAEHYAAVLGTDVTVKKILDKLEADGLADNTIVIFFSDHGAPQLIRHKQFCYEGGIKVPLIFRWPKNFQISKVGLVNKDLVSTIDIGPTSLAFAGIPAKPYMEGRDIFSKEYEPRKYVISARDRCDYTIDRIRAVVTPRYKYIRSFLTDRPYLQPQYRDRRPTLKTLIELRTNGKMTPVQEIFCGEKRIPHELYDLETDPDEINNLANNPDYAVKLKELKDILDNWTKESDDKGQYPESAEGLLQVKSIWGKRCINPEFTKVTEKYGEIKRTPRKKKKKKKNEAK